MYIVKIKGSGDTIAICTREEDALAFLKTKLAHRRAEVSLRCQAQSQLRHSS